MLIQFGNSGADSEGRMSPLKSGKNMNFYSEINKKKYQKSIKKAKNFAPR